jgi:hypothetical protein
MQLPGPVRAIVGLIAVAADEAKQLPDRAIELPMLAVSTALQASLRAQQRYARLAARGDDVINRRPPGDEPPPWATFDEPVPEAELRAAGLDDPDPARRARAASQLLDELLGVGENTSAPPETSADGVAKAKPTAAPKKTPGKATAGPRKAAAKKTAARKAGPSAAPKQPAKRATATKRAAGSKGKTINAPRHTTPSQFDSVTDDD